MRFLRFIACAKCGSTEVNGRGKCAGCAKAASRKWLAANRESENARNAIWRAKNKDKFNEAQSAYRAANPDKVKASQAKYRKENVEKLKANLAVWRTENPQKIKDSRTKWLAANPGITIVFNQNRRARKKSVGGMLSAGLPEKLFKLQKGKCICCKKPLGDDYHLDHRVPLFLGGSNSDENMQLLRKRCNLQKGTQHPIDFMQGKGFLL